LPAFTNSSIDGHDIRTFDLAQYRRQLGIVSQVPFLFSGTVADNIRYAAPDVTDEEILSMARKIGNGEWLETLPNGMQTEVGERGGRLSMGQRQLVALMRVLMQKPAIFILDEATASIDPFTEWQIGSSSWIKARLSRKEITSPCSSTADIMPCCTTPISGTKAWHTWKRQRN
jgi:ABC-type multidrug transport system fused ATPase/permease subunit